MAPVLLALLLPNVAHRAQRKFSVPEAGGTVSLPAGTAVMLPLDGCEAGSTSGTMRLVFAVRAHVDSRQSVVHQMAKWANGWRWSSQIHTLFALAIHTFR